VLSHCHVLQALLAQFHHVVTRAILVTTAAVKNAAGGKYSKTKIVATNAISAVIAVINS